MSLKKYTAVTAGSAADTAIAVVLHVAATTTHIATAGAISTDTTPATTTVTTVMIITAVTAEVAAA